MVASLVLMVGVLGALVLMDTALRTTGKTKVRESATNLARELFEGARSVPYNSLTTSSLEDQLQGISGLADESTAAGWTIRRRNKTLTIVSTVCAMDDARDGGGTRAAGGFCADSVAENTPDTSTLVADRNPEDYKRVRVEVQWSDGNVDRYVRQTSIINNPGSAGGPAVSTLTFGGSASPPVYTNAVANTLTFALTTSSTPATINWLLDGASQGPVTVTGLLHNFSWNLGNAGTLGDPNPAGSIVDGSYIVSAEAFDRYAVAGPSRSLTMTINRTPPDKVEGLAGGRNGSIVEMEWLEVADRDIIGYRVFRLNADNSRGPQVCALAKVTECVDPSPPADPILKYVVYAYDNDGATTSEREGPVASDALIVKADNNPPNEPTLTQVTANPDGTRTLRWLRPLIADPDGDAIDFYRVYRDGEAIGDRYSRWDDASNLVTFVDGAADSSSHCYSVSAVDSFYAESNINGPECG